MRPVVRREWQWGPFPACHRRTSPRTPDWTWPGTVCGPPRPADSVRFQQ